MTEQYNFCNAFYKSASKTPKNIAIISAGQTYNYGEIWQKASQLAAFIAPRLKSRRVGILASRSVTAYIGILGAAAGGATYVPLSLKLPEERLIILLEKLELDALVVDLHGAKLMSDLVLEKAPALIIRSDDAQDIINSTSISQLPEKMIAAPIQRAPSDLAYIMFTSGSTGTPKGVMLPNAAIQHYLDETENWTKLTPDDRVAEAHDITFDLSVHNMGLAWRAAAPLYLMSPLDMMAPHGFIRKNEITFWLSVPTIINNIRRANRLTTNLLPSLRLAMFCGEPLPLNTAQALAEAAPNAVVENIYGPTEATIACSRQRLTDPAVVTETRDIVSIGVPYSNMDIAIFGTDDMRLPVGQVGEMALAGNQLAEGYFNAPDLTDKVFRMIDGVRWYFTGDLGYCDENGAFHHMGRTDNQVKMKGNRIELEEVEKYLRDACKDELATVVAWPLIDSVPQGLVGFTTNDDVSETMIQHTMRARIPHYMVPSRIVLKSDMPRNISDKIDRKALFAELDLEMKAEVISA